MLNDHHARSLPQTLTAVCRLVRAVPAVIFCVTFPPERNAFVILAHKLQQEEK